MDYYSIFPNSGYNYISDVEFDRNAVDYCELFKCHKVDGQFMSNFRFIVNCGFDRWPDLIDSPYTWPICSSKMRDLLYDSIGDQVEVLDVVLEGSLNRSYSVVNILKKVYCLDMEESDVEYSEETEYSEPYFHVNHAVLFRERIPVGVDIFRLGEDGVSYYVSERLIGMIQEASLDGICARQVDMVG